MSMNLSPNDLYKLGFIPGEHEEKADFYHRVSETLEWAKERNHKNLECEGLDYSLGPGLRIPEEQLKKDSEICHELYGISPTWVPAYLQNKGMPLLTGGMAVQFLNEKSQQVFSWFQLKTTFSHREKWLIYSRKELISHEMCHIARFPLQSVRYEETLAYQTSTSRLRRSIGGSLLTPKDQQFLLLSIFLWMIVDLLKIALPETGSLFGLGAFKSELISFLRLPFPSLVFLGLWRCRSIHKELQKAKLNLSSFLTVPQLNKVIFSLSDSQIKGLSNLSPKETNAWVNKQEGFQFEFLRSHL
jgi:hypothetical protein